MSGSVHLIEPVRVMPVMGEPKGYYTFSKAMGCGGHEVGSEDTLRCLRRVSADEINSPRWTGILQSIGYLPYIDHELVFADYLSREAAGAFAKVPYLIGSTENELPHTLKVMHLDQSSELVGEDHAPITLFTLFMFTCGAAMASLQHSTFPYRH
jgi:hypothetical protein